jgi:alpha-tubulin suppressor-like RCC1 family protein
MQGATPVSLVAMALRPFISARKSTAEVYSWGNGANYQLGTGFTGVAATPVRVECLHERRVVQIAAAKYHSAAVTGDGELLTWGFGLGGRLGHPEHHIHSGERAVIQPQPVTALGRKQVRPANSPTSSHAVLGYSAAHAMPCCALSYLTYPHLSPTACQ